MDREQIARYIRDVIGNKEDDLYWFNIADWHIAEIEKAKKESVDAANIYHAVDLLYKQVKEQE